ncbi:MAG: recombination protein RecR [Parcubacteria group bacterium Gr01-1014_20]|nr:MAG: recombination protein RecR [Parcubacteria group bacterium Gr01-1014_20]
MILPDKVKRIIERLSEWPSIGPRQATRLAFYLVGRGNGSLREAVADLNSLQDIKLCENCFFVHENSGALCNICGDSNRKTSIIAVIEKETDLISIENTRKFNGRYFIIGPLSRLGVLGVWQKNRLDKLKTFIQRDLDGKADEIILALNPTTGGDFGATILVKELSPLANRITRLGRGLPMGGEIEFADDETLSEALAKRN